MKLLKWTGIVFLLLTTLSFLIPKGGPNWFRERSKYLTGYPDTYEIVVDFSKPSCQERLFIYKFSEEAELI